MSWSIYAFIPIVWLLFILVAGLIRASFKVGRESVGDVELLGAEYRFTDLALRCYRGDPKDIIRKAHQEVAGQLFNSVKDRILFRREYDVPRCYHSIRGHLTIVK